MALWWKIGTRSKARCVRRVSEIAVGDHLARQIALPLDTQNLILQVHQAAAFQAQLPQAARAEKQVEVLHAAERMARARHAEARFQQRLVVGFAVIRHQHIELRQVLGQAIQLRGFFAIVAHEKLAQAETRRLDRPDADQERVRPGAAGEAGGLGIEKGPSGGMRRGE